MKYVARGKIMITQGSITPRTMSKKLSQFLALLDTKEYGCHGYSECARNHSLQLLRKQQFGLEAENIEILFDTAICQPFLFVNEDNELDVAGVMDYDPKTQTGNLQIKTQTGTLEIHDVHSYHVYAYINNKFLPTNSVYLPEYNELEDVYISAISKELEKYILRIYHNTQLVFCMEDVYECEFYQHAEFAKYIHRKGYVRFSKSKNRNIFENYLYDINSETLFALQDSEGMPSCYIPEMNRDFNSVYSKKMWFHYKDDIVKDPWIKVALHLSESKTSQVIAEFIKNAEQYKIIENIFSDDPTVNIEVLYKSFSKELRFLYYCSKKEPYIFGHGIMGLSLDEVAVGTKNNQDEHHHVYEHTPYHVEQCIYINQHLYERCGENVALNRLPHKICDRYISSHDMCVFLTHHTTHNGIENPNRPGSWKEDFTEEAELYDAIADKIAKSGNLKTRWKNEYALYKIVNAKFPDAVYQYHCHWLGHQSLDVYVPSKNIAFEYQGKQHYEAVSFFGGEEQLKNQLERDRRKRQLCKDNGVQLIEWRYDEPVSSTLLTKKVKNILA